FGVFGNMCNIAVNTQGVEAERLFDKPIMTSFHGAWSLGGFTGALIGLLMINVKLSPLVHFWIIAAVIFLNILFNQYYLVHGRGEKTHKKPSFFRKPEGVLLQLGIIGFCSMATEGAMFDWSGVYFKDIVKAPSSLVVLGYTSFMVMMATGRFVGDQIIVRLGRKRTMQVSGIVISTGMFTAVIFPFIIPAMLGFMLIGIGVSAIVPTVYSLAGRNSKVSPGIALATVSSVSYLGFLMGPPLIGYISALFSLQYAYAVIGCFGIIISLIVGKLSAVRE
ncbi:MAG: MFS transporter, partial [Pedobacter sp.]